MRAASGAPHWTGPHTGKDICRSLSHSDHVHLQSLPLCRASQRYGLAERFFKCSLGPMPGWGHRGCTCNELCETISCVEQQRCYTCASCWCPSSAAGLHLTLSDAEGIVTLAKDYQPKGLAVVAISSNSVRTHPQDGPDQMAADAKQFGVCLLSVRY